METSTEKPVAPAASTGAISLADAIEVGYLDLAKTEFYKTGGGFTGLRYDGRDYKRVALRRALPVASPEEYISVADHENKEIGILRAITDLAAPQMAIVTDELGKRYYTPSILQIKSVKDKMGYVYMELLLQGVGERYDKSCAVKDVNRNIRMLGDDRLAIFDVDGNRYQVPSLAALDAKSRRMLEPYLF